MSRKRDVEIAYAAQNGICAWCGRKVAPFENRIGLPDHWWPSEDHVIPRALNGGDHLGNKVMMHRACNVAKGEQPPNGCVLIWREVVRAAIGWVEPPQEIVHNGAIADAMRAALEKRKTP